MNDSLGLLLFIAALFAIPVALILFLRGRGGALQPPGQDVGPIFPSSPGIPPEPLPDVRTWSEIAVARGWRLSRGDVDFIASPAGMMRLHANASLIVDGLAHDRPFRAFQPAGWSFARLTTSAGMMPDQGQQAGGYVTVPIPVEFAKQFWVVPRVENDTSRRDLPLTDGFAFESDAFNERYIVWSHLGRKETTDLISPRGMEWLMWAPPGFKLCVWGRTAFTVSVDGLTPEFIESSAAVLTAFVGFVPEFTWDAIGHRRPDSSA